MSDSASSLRVFLAELKRRRVYRVAVVYVIVGFAVIEGGQLIFDALEFPRAAWQLVVVLTILGFPIALVLAWAYDITPEGVRRTEAASAESDAAPASAAPAVADGVERRSIAVLPFANMSDDPENEYFSDGMTEEIINALTQLKDLRVAARTSCFAFKGKTPDIGEVGAKLNVATVLEGSVRKAGNRLRITAQLVNVADGYHLWSERYDREMEDVFAIQDEIARAIADKLQVTLAAGVTEPLVRPSTENLEAYDLYLRGRYFVNQGGEGPRTGLECFRHALACDPEYALAHAGIAEAYMWLGNTGILRPKEAMPKAREAAIRALELDETLAEAHLRLGWMSWTYDFEWSIAEKRFLRALELNPDLPQAHSGYGFHLASMGRIEESLSELRRGVELDPLAQIASTWLGQVLAFLGRFPDAIDQLRSALELDPTSWHANDMLGMGYRLNSNHTAAIEALQTAIALAGRHPWSLANLAQTYAASGSEAQAEAIYDELVARSRGEYVPPATLAFVGAALGRKDEAFEWLERAYEERDALLVWLKILPPYDPLRDDPRFDVLLEKMGLK
ncbi:MAG: tetratricopeptide repeat protein [Gemmatimonadales bacterium]|nr:tetratricopeptide repeat protein [Gemmatimonadales bacterium]NIN73542.1 tetratricopeptide repeat protein [Gemmatimonadota bacterium]NIQ99894.1 tetratricopeptide repeat protein [Gemmatimonadales bacterium]